MDGHTSSIEVKGIEAIIQHSADHEEKSLSQADRFDAISCLKIAFIVANTNGV